MPACASTTAPSVQVLSVSAAMSDCAGAMSPSRMENARAWLPFMSSVIRVGGRCVSFAKKAPDSCRVDSFLRSPRTPVPTPTADCLCRAL